MRDTEDQEDAIACLEDEMKQGELDPDVAKRVLRLARRIRTNTATILSINAGEKKRELSAESAYNILTIIKFKFFSSTKNKNLGGEWKWDAVERALWGNPEKIYALYKLQESGGKPELVSVTDDFFIFEDRSKETPEHRRNLTYRQALIQADSFGAYMQTPESYRTMQGILNKFDTESASFLYTEPEDIKEGLALCGSRKGMRVNIVDISTKMRSKNLGWRGAVYVKR